MLGIETKLIFFHPFMDEQTKYVNQELEQYLQFFVNYRQKNWSEQLVTAKFAVHNKTYSAIKVTLFMANYSREISMGVDVRKKEKIEKMTEFAKRIKKVQGEVEVVLRKVQEEMKR